MILVLISILSAIIILGLLVKYELGISAYIVYLFCVPLITIYFFRYQFGLNVISLLALALFIVKYKKPDKINNQLLYPFYFLYVTLGLCIPFHWEMPFFSQLAYWEYDLTGLILPFVIVNVTNSKNSHANWFTWSFYVAIFINTIYHSTLLSSFGVNPYIDDVINSVRNGVEKDFSFLEGEGIRVFGYISSCFRTVTNYGAFLIPAVVFVFDDYQKHRKLISLVAFIMLCICIITCGSRSVLYAFVLMIAFYMYLKRNFKILAYTSILSFVVILIINYFIPSFGAFVFSFNSTEIAGSTTDMRYDQYIGCYHEFINNPLGNGYGWSNWYKATHGGRHPVLYGFESLPIQVISESGILGILIWTNFASKYYKKVKNAFTTDLITRDSLLLLLFGYFALTFFTGDYGGMRNVMIVYALIICNSTTINSNNRNII